jgi:hypothetical protein
VPHSQQQAAFSAQHRCALTDTATAAAVRRAVTKDTAEVTTVNAAAAAVAAVTAKYKSLAAVERVVITVHVASIASCYSADAACASLCSIGQWWAADVATLSESIQTLQSFTIRVIVA